MKRILLLFLALLLVFSISSCNNKSEEETTREEETAESFETLSLADEGDKNGNFDNVYSYEEICKRLYDTSLNAQKTIGNERSYEASSYERLSTYNEETDTYEEWGSLYDNNGYLYKQGENEFVIAEDVGAGYISRLWWGTPSDAQIGIFLDDMTKPVIKTTFNNLQKMFETYDELCLEVSGGGRNIYVPFSFNECFKIVYYNSSVFYYQVNYTIFSSGSTAETYEGSEEQKASLQIANEKLKARDIFPTPTKELSCIVGVNESKVLLNAKENASITYFSLKIDIPEEEYNSYTSLSDFVLKITWDGAENPSVNIPISDFFATPYGNASFSSYALGVKEDGTLWTRFYMPFKSAKIELVNTSDKARTINASFTIEKCENIENYNRFCVSWKYLLGVAEDDRYPDCEMLSINGCGRYVGTALHVYQQYNEMWWGEGDEKFFIDGEKMPSWFGTGSEDYFGYSWGSADLFETAFLGQPRCGDNNEQVHNGKGNIENYRFHFSDSVPFTSSFTACLEKYDGQDKVRASATTYFYLTAGTYQNYEAICPSKTLLSFNKEDFKDFVIKPDYSYNGTEIMETLVSSENCIMQSFGEEWYQTYGVTDRYCSCGQILFMNYDKGGSLTFKINLPENATYNFIGHLTSAVDFGIADFYIDNVLVGTQDLYSIGKVVWLDTYTIAENLTLEKGEHTIKIVMSDKNPSSAGYFIGIDKLEFNKK